MTKTFVEDTVEKIGEEVTLIGWVATRRNLGKLIFIDLRDSTGIIQVVCDESASNIHNEDLVVVTGIVQERQSRAEDKECLPVELKAKEIKVLSLSKSLPFPIVGDGHEIDSALRLKYRYLDLRRERLQKAIKFRDTCANAIRDYLHSRGFTEIETPLLTKFTPEGSRDFVVPSRLNKGKFYALPQSPQQYKQLLMVAGFEKYFQIARCLRDEDLRSDRAFEHTQIDLEMSFVERKDVMDLVEEMMISVSETLGFCLKDKPFPVIPYSEAKEKYGSDQFDLRSDSEKAENVLSFAWVVDFPFFEKNDSGEWTFSHNPFSDPIEEHKEKLLSGEIESVKTSQYDLVCNGFELGGGSIRSSNPEILQKVFEILGYSEEQIKANFGHMLEAFEYGAPPHGGIALGLERLLMIILGEEALSEVVAFPASYSGQTSVMDAPSALTPEQLDELGLSIIDPE